MNITVVIPVYNREKIVGHTLDALDAQTFQDFRTILVDNNSTDGTAAVLRRWAERHPGRAEVLTQTHPGAAAARNMGLDAVATPWTLFFDSDDTMSPDHLGRVAAAIAAHPDADIIGWDTDMMCDGVKYRTGVFAARDAMYRSLFNGTMATQRYCARTDLFRRAGGWNADVSIWDDIELGARLLALRPSIRRIDGTPTVFCHFQKESITGSESLTNIAAIDTALGSIARTLGPRRAHWTELKRIIFAAGQGGAGGRRVRDESLARVRQPWRRILFRGAYAWTAAGMPGAARILRIFM